MAEEALVAIVITIKTTLIHILLVQKRRMAEILVLVILMQLRIMGLKVLAEAVVEHMPDGVQLGRLEMVAPAVLPSGCT